MTPPPLPAAAWRSRGPRDAVTDMTEFGPASNGRGNASWSFEHLHIDRRSLGHCRGTFDHPPVNTLTATTVLELDEVVGLIGEDLDLRAVVFDSVNPEFFLTDYEPDDDPGRTAALGVHAWVDLLVRLAEAPVLSIASIRGRAHGAGSEFALACDLRFASRENTLLGRVDVGVGGGPVARLSRLVGRGRALEIVLVGGDLD